MGKKQRKSGINYSGKEGAMCKNGKKLNQNFPKFLIDKKMENSKISITNSQIKRIYPTIQSFNLIDLGCRFTTVDLPQGNNVGQKFPHKEQVGF
jgi:hypothetical protein